MKQSFISSLKHASEGLHYVINNERNMKIHLFVMSMVILCGILFQVSKIEWIICFILFALILSLEIINTAIEALCDLYTKDYHPLIKIAKDTAASAVLISSLLSAVIGLMIFIPRLIFYIQIFI